MKANKSIIVAPRFCGPPTSANGGYLCGLLDKHTPFLSEVTLRQPPPLDKPLQLQWEAEQLNLLDGETLIAYAREGQLEFSAPAPPTFEEARAASRNYIGFEEHPFPSCFVCGPERQAPGDGLHLFAGKVAGRQLHASPWVPDDSLADKGEQVASEFIWAALDCPGAFAIMGAKAQKIVLGRMAARIDKAIKVGEKCVVTAWNKGRDGRKHYSGTALYNQAGQLCAVADAIWFEIN